MARHAALSRAIAQMPLAQIGTRNVPQLLPLHYHRAMAAQKAKGRAWAIFKAVLPFLVILLVLIFVYFLWRYYQPNRKMNFHQTHVSRLHHDSQAIPPLAS